MPPLDLPARRRETWEELRLHGARDLIYAVLFVGLAWREWRGGWAWCLVALLAAEVLITLADFVLERRVRAPLGGLPAGELVMHALMAILYGALLATLAPHLLAWGALPAALAPHAAPPPPALAALLSAMGAGVLAAGLRDLWWARAGARAARG